MKFANLLLVILLVSSWSCNNNSDKKDIEVVDEDTDVVVEPFFDLSLAQWSLHKAIQNGELSPMDFAKKASDMDFKGIEYVNQLYSNEIEKLGMQNMLDSLKAESERYNVENVLIMVDGEGDLADPSEALRNKAVENHKKWVDAAEFLGCHSIRVNTFGTNEPTEWHNAVVDGLTKLSSYAATKNINVLVENHGWLSSDADKLMAAIKAVNMSNCGTLPDFGNWCIKRKEGERWGECEEEYEDIYKGIKMMMPKAKAVSAKAYDFDDDGKETKLDYLKLLEIVRDAGYTGFIGIEYEGSNLSEVDGINATKNLLLNAAEELK